MTQAPPRTDAEAFALLARYDTPTVCNVIELLDVRPRNVGYMDRSIKACFPGAPPIVGYAATATFQGAVEAAPGDVYSGFVDQVEAFLQRVPAPRIVVFQDLDEPPRAATFGEVMCSVYKAFGAVGIITSGAARDLDQVERLGFPCFASEVIASHGYCRVVDHGKPVVVGGLRVEPGDVLHADRNGVTSIPRRLLRETALGCVHVAEAEEEILGLVRKGCPTIQAVREAQKRSRARFDRIAQEVRAAIGAMDA